MTYNREPAVLAMRATRLARLVELKAPRRVLINEVVLVMSCFAPRWLANVWMRFAR